MKAAAGRRWWSCERKRDPCKSAGRFVSRPTFSESQCLCGELAFSGILLVHSVASVVKPCLLPEFDMLYT